MVGVQSEENRNEIACGWQNCMTNREYNLPKLMYFLMFNTS